MTVGSGRYGRTDVVTAFIANGLGEAVAAEDFKTDCSIAWLQRQDGQAWRDIPGCALGRPTRTVVIGPNKGHGVSFHLDGFHIASQGDVLPGVYRVRFSYRLASEPVGTEPHAVRSATFRVD